MPKLLDNCASLMDSQELRDVKRLVSLLKISQTGGMSRIEHEGWWADAKDKVRCGLCNTAIGKVLKSP